MQCPKCGSLNPDTREQCGRCGTQLSAAVAVPDWRKEVTRKVKDYGDRKKSLTTPPGPLKEKGIAVEEPSPPVPDSDPPRIVSDPPPAKSQAPRISFYEKPAERKAAPPPPVAQNHNPPDSVEDLDIWNDDLVAQEGPAKGSDAFDARSLSEIVRARRLEPDFAGSQVNSSFIGRRAAAFLIDTVALTGVYSALFYAYTAFMQDDVTNLLRSAWPAVTELFLVCHFLYYLYFYSTSRQTPGQVFLSIELRDAAAPEIAFHKILARWLSMVLFNVLNLLPLLFGKTHLLLDQISGTEIRALK